MKCPLATVTRLIHRKKRGGGGRGRKAACEMAQPVEVLATIPEDSSSIPRTHAIEGISTQIPSHVHPLTHTKQANKGRFLNNQKKYDFTLKHTCSLSAVKLMH